jgi:FAM192A/Fyv6, N-terminal domain
MSLSFVSSAVLSSTDGISHNEETEVTSKELEAVRKNAGRSKSLFEQLRSNQEDDEEKRAETERSRMRGVLALDEDDVAHLNALNRSKAESELQRNMEMEHEMALFRAAKEERASGHVVVDDEGDKEKETPKEETSHQMRPGIPAIVPKVVAKRRRKPIEQTIAKKHKESSEKPQEIKESLGGLLSGYGSSSEEEN